LLVWALALGLAQVAWGQAIPAKADDAGKAKADAAGASGAVAAPADNAAAPGAPKADARKEAAIKAVKAIVAQAEKTLELCAKEQEKPVEKRDTKKINEYKLTAARIYVNAALKAMGYARNLKGDDKQAFLDEYDKPNRAKGIELLMELALAAEKKGDFRQATILLKDILSIDPKNAEAQAALVRVAEETKTARTDPSRNQGGSEDKTNVKDWEQSYKGDYTGGYTHTDWKKYGRGGW
jgi:hypothetical protein